MTTNIVLPNCTTENDGIPMLVILGICVIQRRNRRIQQMQSEMLHNRRLSTEKFTARQPRKTDFALLPQDTHDQMMVDTKPPVPLLDLNGIASALATQPSASTHSCSLCPKTFPTMKLLVQHQQTFHTDKSFVCEICGKAFRFRSNLAEHRSVHTALKPFVCKFCGNLTKHILKHHKKEQNEHIGKDDIIIKKGKKSVKDPAAVDFLEQSMFVIGPTKSSPPEEVPVQVKEEPAALNGQFEKSIFLSLGFDQGSMDLTNGTEEHTGTESSEAQPMAAKQSEPPAKRAKKRVRAKKPKKDNASVPDTNTAKPEPEARSTSPFSTTVGGAASLHALLASMASSPPKAQSPALSTSSSVKQEPLSPKTQCTECGKHFRKGSQLQIHMVLAHGYPPIEENGLDEKQSDRQPNEIEACLPLKHVAKNGSKHERAVTLTDMIVIQSDVRAIKAQLAEIKTTPIATTNAKNDHLLSALDSRVSRLEKQVEMSLNSIYTLVQLQTGLSSSINKFRDEMNDQLHTIKNLIADNGHH